VLGEVPTWNLLGGMVLIFLGLLVIDGRLLRRPQLPLAQVTEAVEG